MDGKDFNKLTTEYTEKYLKDSETFKDHLEDLEKSLMDGKNGHEPMPQWQKLALMAADMVIDITDQDKIMSLALSGGKAAELTLGASYLEGDHVGIDFKKALFWLSRAAKNDLPMAHFCIGIIYCEGLGVDKDFNNAINSFTKSIELGIGDEPGYSGWNGIIAEALIGEMYYLGGNGITQDNMQALKWIAPAAELNDMKAQSLLAEMYFFGDRSLTQNLNEAFTWYLKAAEQGEIVAQTMLGYMYQYGQGTLQDYKEAFKWYSLALEKNSIAAAKNLAVMYRNGHGVTKDEEMCFSLNLKAAKHGDVDAQIQVMGSYVHGNGVAISKKDAAYWCNLAREKGSPAAEAYWKSYELSKYE
jgi:uncharacterized protein